MKKWKNITTTLNYNIARICFSNKKQSIRNKMTEKEYTKVAFRGCSDCGKELMVLCNESCQIVAIRCPACTEKCKDKEEKNYERIWEEECGGRCAILHLERCPRYEEGECKFPETRKAKEIVESQRN